mmetsp:Transcript_13905/g.16589  ORF Transcript_13905/g.16589 Transcript_13905/m.16589 type:complete len:85 (-) Transcript_13905:688-942(-)
MCWPSVRRGLLPNSQESVQVALRHHRSQLSELFRVQLAQELLNGCHLLFLTGIDIGINLCKVVLLVFIFDLYQGVDLCEITIGF